MELRIICIGRMKQGPERDLLDKFTQRAQKMGGGLGLKGPNIIEIPESNLRRPEERKRDEMERISRHLEQNGLICVLDERGKSMTSVAFANYIAKTRDDGQTHLNFIIGGPDGLDADLRQRSHFALSFSPLTWPHQLVRVLLCEQLYRAMTILANHPYHRA